MRRAILSILLAALVTAMGAVAAPALSTRTYIPPPVDFELEPRGAAGGEEAGGKVLSHPLRAPKRFDIVGVRWDEGDPETDLEVRVRKQGGGWSRWAEATRDSDHAPDPARGEANRQRASAPVWAGGADEVQYRTARKLGGVKLEFINTTGTATAADRAETAVRRAANKSITGVAGLFSASAAAPSMVSRAEWGGDRYCQPRDSQYDMGSVKAVFVHHTVNANSYSSSDAASLVLGICRYHRDTNGWDDIGYNFLVDKYGRIYEGREGGISKPVIGAQAQGWNAQSTGVANLGTFESSGQTGDALRAMDRLISWKLDNHGTPRGGRVTLTSAGGSTNRYSEGTNVAFNRISGHRDGNLTSCPGSALYRQLPALREAVEDGGDTTAPATPKNLTARSGAGTVSLDWSDNSESDLAGYRIYRRSASGEYASIATTRSSAYTDNSVRGGETYYYRVKAYDTSGNHSYWSWYATGKPTVAWDKIVDNADSGLFSASSDWGTSSRVATRYGADYRYARPAAVSDSARFRLPPVPRSGSYTVYVRHPAHEDYSSSAPIGVETRSGIKWARLDLRRDGGSWVPLGTFTLAAGDEPQVVLSRWTSASGWLIADAVRAVER